MKKTKEKEFKIFKIEPNKTFTMIVNKKVIKRLVIFTTATILSLLSLIFTSELENLFNFDYFANSVLTKEDTKIHFIDVGEGDCTVIELVDGKVVMIDTGPEEKWNKINTYFEFLKIPKRIDYLILTHTDKDHVGNAERILENFEVGSICLPKVYSNYEIANNLVTNNSYKVYDNLMWNNICYKIRTALNDEQISYMEDIITIDNSEENKQTAESYSINIFPTRLNYYKDDNDYSPIIWAKLGYHQSLFTGDASKIREQEFLEDYKTLIEMQFEFKIDLLKVGHHGSKTSSSLEFLEKINPRMVVISCGKNNSYGHPANETINNLKQVNNDIRIYRTDISNSIMYKDTFTGTSAKLVINYEYENFDNIYFKLYYLVITIILIAFFSFVFPLFFQKKLKF